MISPEGIEMDPEKISAVKDWETSTCIRDVQCFLGFAYFPRRFIEGFSRTCTSLFNLLKKADAAPPDNPKDSTDASDYVVSGIGLSQCHLQEDGKSILHPIAFQSEKMSPAECNYGIGDKELLAIVACLEK